MDREIRIGFLCNKDMPGFAGYMQGVRRLMQEQPGLRVRFVPHQRHALKWLSEWRPHGVVGRTESAAVVQTLRRMDVPVVQFFYQHRQDDFPYVGVDFSATCRLVADEFRRTGLRHFAYFGLADGGSAAMFNVRFRDALGDHAESYSTLLIDRERYPWQFYAIENHCTRQTLRALNQRIRRWLEGLPKPVGILPNASCFGVDLLEACKQHGLHVPDEVAVISTSDDEGICDFTDPPMSFVQQDRERIAYEACRTVLRMMRGGRPSDRAIAPLRVVVQGSSDVVAVADPAVARAMRCMRERCDRLGGVGEIAAESGVSRRALERRFRQHTGRTVLQELVRLRIARARVLLTDTDLPLDQIATMCGFASASHFSHTFLQAEGVRPGAYRRQQRVLGSRAE